MDQPWLFTLATYNIILQIYQQSKIIVDKFALDARFYDRKKTRAVHQKNLENEQANINRELIEKTPSQICFEYGFAFDR